MSDPGFDRDAAHRYFSAACFNAAWDLMDRSDRTAEEDEEMLRLSLASHWHWSKRPDYDAEKASIAYWQTSRVHALLKQPDQARRYAERCLAAARQEGVGPFFLGYAYEALARAEALAGHGPQARDYVALARRAAAGVADVDDKKLLEDDLASIA